jgi:cardiolipin synthase
MMKTRHALYTEVEPFYIALLKALSSAQHKISMMYFTYDYGEWSSEINRMLRTKAEAGIQVRLMVDEIGLAVDAPANALRNRTMMRGLEQDGIQVNLFRPQGRRISRLDRLHIKLCAVDQHALLIGGSNIGDYYLDWQDTNLLVEGRLGDTAHRLYDYIQSHSEQGHPHWGRDESTRLNPAKMHIDDTQLLLTLPGHRKDIRRELLRLILDAEESVHIRNWYFLPDNEILNALLSQAERGVSVNILLSDRTRVRLVDAANYVAGHKLARAGAHVYRYTQRYMHSKVAWNDQGDVVLGSANMDEKALNSNFECSLRLRSAVLAWQLQQAFVRDCHESTYQTPRTLGSQPLHRQTASYICLLASSWL